MKLMTMLNDYIPPGIELKRELKYIAVGLVGAMLYSFSFFFAYISARNDLYYYDYRTEEYILNTNAVITEFETLLAGRFAGFAVFILFLFLMGIYHYVYHYQGSKSIWLMKRLPNRMELHRRCLLLPLFAAIASIAIMGMLFLIYYGVYIMCTPEMCLPLGMK